MALKCPNVEVGLDKNSRIESIDLTDTSRENKFATSLNLPFSADAGDKPQHPISQRFNKKFELLIIRI